MKRVMKKNRHLLQRQRHRHHDDDVLPRPRLRTWQR
jgi:hypothetical protein